MKIIGISNFCLDNVTDILIADNLNDYYGNLIIKFLESKANEHDTYYPKLVDDNYELYDGDCY
jgi:hypothetical protein